MPVRVRICLLIKVVLKLILHPLTDALWLLDEILFPSYRKQPIRSPVFIIGGFRTGSTSLHRTLYSVVLAAAEDNNCGTTVLSPRFVELFFPFLTLQYFFDFLERRNSVVLSTLQRFFVQTILGKELIQRHPMAWMEPEEDDVLLAKYHYTGWYTMFFFPDIVFQDIKDLSWHKKRSIQFYKRSMQKLLWRRGGPSTVLLCKNHWIDFVPWIQEEFVDAKFIFIVRHPKYTIPSLYSLAQCSLERFALEPLLPIHVAILSHLTFWDHYTSEELKLFRTEKGKNKKNNSLCCCWIRHSDYVTDIDKVLKGVFEFLNMKLQDEVVSQCLHAVRLKQRSIDWHRCDSKHSIVSHMNDTDVSERYKTYINTFNLL